MSASESSTLHANTPVPTGQQSITTSKAPLLGEGFKVPTNQKSSKPSENSEVDVDASDSASGTAKSGKRRLFGFGKKKTDEKVKSKKKDDGTHAGNAPLTRPLQQTQMTNSPPRSSYPYQHPSSPPSRKLFSSSPHVVSPAGSQIFERDVQESAIQPNSPAIPSHIRTEDYIPPVLDASSQAITNNDIDPDTVEIVMHSSHQPAVMSMSGISSSEPGASMWTDELVAHPDKDDAASNYGALDSTDIRRLSFISFADVVQSEHAEHAGNRDSIYIAGLSALSSPGISPGVNRSPSPVRSPVSSFGFGTSPPTSKSASVKGVELSPVRKQTGLASPTSLHSPTSGGELTIETMSQAVKKTGSGDLSGSLRSLPLSPVSFDGPDTPFR
ncbi:uncharacterized protein EAF01_004416 [Botrytis porri]|uniref:uncharacterized protein n=1 Tax=Botrytis porri TaxID=87229 RepID=UPI00190041A5|nr:uncharacterized protein EAF01_004416 [Botrytis porri]KAF7908661.1 hypothetical protein EAF01_004416 [Botrytis porri]